MGCRWKRTGWNKLFIINFLIIKMATSFASFAKLKKDKGGKVKFDRRSMRTHMTILESTKLRMVDEIREIQTIAPNLSVSDNEINSTIDKISSYSNFTIINTKLIVVCLGLMRGISPFVEKEFGKKVLENEIDIYRVFDVTDEVKKMKLKEDIMVYSQYINFMENNIEEVSDVDESDYEEDTDYESD